MRYSYPALVLATFAIGQALAGPVKHAHGHRHKKHDEILEVRDDGVWNGINFATVHITYSKGQTWGDATSAAAPVATTAAAVAAAAAVDPTTTSAATAATPTTQPSAGNGIGSPSVQNVVLSSTDSSRLTSLGAQIGKNSATNNGGVWIGSDGAFTSSFVNSGSENIIVVCWGASGSWVNANTPWVTHSLSVGSSITLSFAAGNSGACAAVYGDTQLINGQISETWFEFTFGSISVFDVSREVNMAGHPLSLVGDICTSDMSTCVFKCISGNTCLTGYALDNCSPGSQPGAEYGLFEGAPSGGCRLGSGTHVAATFS